MSEVQLVNWQMIGRVFAKAALVRGLCTVPELQLTMVGQLSINKTRKRTHYSVLTFADHVSVRVCTRDTSGVCCARRARHARQHHSPCNTRRQSRHRVSTDAIVRRWCTPPLPYQVWIHRRSHRRNGRAHGRNGMFERSDQRVPGGEASMDATDRNHHRQATRG